jgi:hypothetical protein
MRRPVKMSEKSAICSYSGREEGQRAGVDEATLRLRSGGRAAAARERDQHHTQRLNAFAVTSHTKP